MQGGILTDIRCDKGLAFFLPLKPPAGRADEYHGEIIFFQSALTPESVPLSEARPGDGLGFAGVVNSCEFDPKASLVTILPGRGHSFLSKQLFCCTRVGTIRRGTVNIVVNLKSNHLNKSNWGKVALTNDEDGGGGGCGDGGSCCFRPKVVMPPRSCDEFILLMVGDPVVCKTVSFRAKKGTSLKAIAVWTVPEYNRLKRQVQEGQLEYFDGLESVRGLTVLQTDCRISHTDAENSPELHLNEQIIIEAFKREARKKLDSVCRESNSFLLNVASSVCKKQFFEEENFSTDNSISLLGLGNLCKCRVSSVGSIRLKPESSEQEIVEPMNRVSIQNYEIEHREELAKNHRDFLRNMPRVNAESSELSPKSLFDSFSSSEEEIPSSGDSSTADCEENGGFEVYFQKYPFTTNGTSLESLLSTSDREVDEQDGSKEAASNHLSIVENGENGHSIVNHQFTQENQLELENCNEISFQKTFGEYSTNKIANENENYQMKRGLAEVLIHRGLEARIKSIMNPKEEMSILVKIEELGVHEIRLEDVFLGGQRCMNHDGGLLKKGNILSCDVIEVRDIDGGVHRKVNMVWCGRRPEGVEMLMNAEEFMKRNEIPVCVPEGIPWALVEVGSCTRYQVLDWMTEMDQSEE